MTNTFFWSVEAMLASAFKKHHASILSSVGDGDCLFHSISNATNNDAPTLRSAYCSAIRVCPNVFRAFCRQNGVWSLSNKQAADLAHSKTFLPCADCVAFLAQLLGVAIIVIASPSNDLRGFWEVLIYEPSNVDPPFSYIVLFLNLQNSHYDLVQVPNTKMFERDDPFIKALYMCANDTVLKVPSKLLEVRQT